MEGIATRGQTVLCRETPRRIDKRGKDASSALAIAIALGIVRASAYGVLEA
jgi:hypothetical protein